MLNVSQDWKSAFPDAHAGILVMRGVANPAMHERLENRKRELEGQLRARFEGADRKLIEALPSIQAYNAYYKPFKKTFHVQHQLESIVFKGRRIPATAALVEAMFMAEVKNQLLTAGHDLDQVQPPLILEVSNGGERYTILRGEDQELKAGDMFMQDGQGVISSILYGPDRRTSIRAATRNVMFAVYAPRGISPQGVRDHLEDIRENVLIVSPAAQVETLQVFGAD
ncbi:MAG TPA: phenylalanine--tRNA ligase beta subunit-related protein [Anaerolineales bacterium]|jgi:DNA/RNA-binding domain of Phe-tRNA-synthetase-like protein